MSAVSARELEAILLAGRGEFLRFLERRVGDGQLAQDLLQEAFLRATERAAQLEDKDSAVAWFYRTLRNAVTDHFRRAGASSRALEALARELDEEPGTPSPDSKNRTCQCVSRAAKGLTPDYAEALQRVEVDGLSVKDFAAAAGITSNNAAVRVFRARAALEKEVKACCGSCADDGCVDCTCGA